MKQKARKLRSKRVEKLAYPFVQKILTQIITWTLNIFLRWDKVQLTFRTGVKILQKQEILKFRIRLSNTQQLQYAQSIPTMAIHQCLSSYLIQKSMNSLKKFSKTHARARQGLARPHQKINNTLIRTSMKSSRPSQGGRALLHGQL